MKLFAKINYLLPAIKKTSNLDNFSNILVVSNTGLGDTILSTPAIISLRKSFPNINITFMINKKMFPLFRGFEYVDDFVLYSSGFISQIRAITQLRKRNIDTIFLFHSNGPEDIFFSILSGAQNILKMTDNFNHEFKYIFYNKPNLSIQHDIEKKLDLVRLFSPKKIFKRMLIPKCFYKSNRYINKEQNFKYIGIQLGAQDVYKMWPVENFISLVKKINKKIPRTKFVLLGSTKHEKKLTKKFILNFQESDLIIDLCTKTPIEKLPSVLNDLDLLITNDTGTLHLAIALEKKTLSLFGPTNHKEFGPYQDLNNHEIIALNGVKFVKDRCLNFKTKYSMKTITIEQVFAGVIKII